MIRALLAAGGAALLLAGTAHADADPASDVLLGASVFYPYTPRVAPAVEHTLDAEVAAAGKQRFPIKVALIGSPVDLGAIPDLFGKPREYARFLDQEISFAGKQALLVVMPDGIGVAGLNAGATSAAASLAKPAGATSDALARAAIAAVSRLAAASGHPIGAAGAGSSAGGADGGSSPLVPAAILAVVAVTAAGAVIAVRRRASR